MHKKHSNKVNNLGPPFIESSSYIPTAKCVYLHLSNYQAYKSLTFYIALC